MFLPPPAGILPPGEVLAQGENAGPLRREIAIGERLLFRTRSGSRESVVAADGRVLIPGGERIPAVRRTLAELRAALPGLSDVRRLVAPGTGFPLLADGRVLRVAEGTTLLDATRGLVRVEDLVLFDAADRATRVARPAFGNVRLATGDAILLGAPVPDARATIVGGVLNPGGFEIDESGTLEGLVRAAGGFAPRAKRDGILIERGRTKLGPFSLPADAATLVRPGDLVRVVVNETAAYVSIAGAVKRPGLIEVEPEMTVERAIEVAGGLTLPVDVLIVSLRSITDPKRKAVKAKATELRRFPTLKAGDLLEIAPPPRRSQ